MQTLTGYTSSCQACAAADIAACPNSSYRECSDLSVTDMGQHAQTQATQNFQICLLQKWGKIAEIMGDRTAFQCAMIYNDQKDSDWFRPTLSQYGRTKRRATATNKQQRFLSSATAVPPRPQSADKPPKGVHLHCTRQAEKRLCLSVLIKTQPCGGGGAACWALLWGSPYRQCLRCVLYVLQCTMQ